MSTPSEGQLKALAALGRALRDAAGTSQQEIGAFVLDLIGVEYGDAPAIGGTFGAVAQAWYARRDPVTEVGRRTFGGLRVSQPTPAPAVEPAHPRHGSPDNATPMDGVCAACGDAIGRGMYTCVNCGPRTHVENPAIRATWSDVQPGDEVYSEVDGRWWEVSEADAGQVTIANADAGRTITFTPIADAPVRVRRGTIGAAADALRAGGLNVEVA